jgi:hypothetical protein
VAAVLPATVDPIPVSDGVVVLADPTPPIPPLSPAFTDDDLRALNAFVRDRVRVASQAIVQTLTGRLPD